MTTVGQVVAKFALTNWLQEQAALTAVESIEFIAAYEAAEFGAEKIAWARTVVAASREKTMAKADAGTDIHDTLEFFQQNMDCKHEDETMCAAVRMCIEANTGLDFFEDFKAETRFCDTEHGFAGMCDLHNEAWIIDYKSKDTVDKKTRGFPEQAEQLAAYANGLGYPDARLANVFISRSDPSQVVWFEHKDDLAWERFRHALMLWSVSKKFGPYYSQLIKDAQQ